jgi:hypothetical protein
MNGFSPAGRVAAMYGMFKVERLCKFGNICCIGIHIMSIGYLGGPVPTAIMGNNLIYPSLRKNIICASQSSPDKDQP